MARLAGARTPHLWKFGVSFVLLAGALTSCTSTARVTDIYMALDGNGDRKRNVFFTDSKELHCVIELGIGRPGTTVEAIVRQNQSYDFIADRFFDADRVLANVESAPKPQEGIQKLDLALKAKGPDGSDADGQPFPPGRYQCEAYLDGHLEQVSIFNIDFPPCPTASIPPGSLCYGFYKKIDVCPKYGDTSRDPARCRCTFDKGWECDP
jgi:hypothetical protein